MSDDEDQQSLILDLVDDPVVTSATCSDGPPIRLPDHRATSGLSRIGLQIDELEETRTLRMPCRPALETALLSRARGPRDHASRCGAPLITVDMEGVAGVVAPDDVRPGHSEYERNRTYMTDEASAAVRGILAYEPGAGGRHAATSYDRAGLPDSRRRVARSTHLGFTAPDFAGAYDLIDVFSILAASP
ncbi:MAG: M55 family metallopeptidase [Actinomycetota bacterium]|nr:M55 family metallopeptidase [Actinomycetota bacterium]